MTCQEGCSGHILSAKLAQIIFAAGSHFTLAAKMLPSFFRAVTNAYARSAQGCAAAAVSVVPAAAWQQCRGLTRSGSGSGGDGDAAAAAAGEDSSGAADAAPEPAVDPRRAAAAASIAAALRRLGLRPGEGCVVGGGAATVDVGVWIDGDPPVQVRFVRWRVVGAGARPCAWQQSSVVRRVPAAGRLPPA